MDKIKKKLKQSIILLYLSTCISSFSKAYANSLVFIIMPKCVIRIYHKWLFMIYSIYLLFTQFSQIL